LNTQINDENGYDVDCDIDADTLRQALQHTAGEHSGVGFNYSCRIKSNENTISSYLKK
jgi:hypothetical protein